MKSTEHAEQIQFPTFRDFDNSCSKDQKESIWNKTVKAEENSYYWNGAPVITKGKSVVNRKPRVVELFSGCGGTSLGFEMAGYHISLGCDIHKPSVDTFRNAHPKASTILGDIRALDANSMFDSLPDQNVDVLIGGVPCQGFSLNNRKRYEHDERNLLYKHFVRFVELLQPKVVVLENVSGMRSTGDFVERIEREIGIAGKMKVRSQLLNAADFGVPQIRKRLVFIGIRMGDFDFREIRRTHGPDGYFSYVNIRDAIGDLPSLQPGMEKSEYTVPPISDYQALMRWNVDQFSLTNHRAPNHPTEVINKISSTEPGMPMYPKFKQRIRLSWDILSPTQVSGGIRPQFQFGHPQDSRGLTIRERCRLQSFPDDFIVMGGIVQGRVQTGNAVPPLLAKAIGLALLKYV